MNQQYPDTLHLAISVSTTSFHSLLQFSSPIPFSRSLLPFSFIHSSFSHSSLSSSIPSFILSSILSSIQPVSHKSNKHTENKDYTTMRLLQTEGYSRLFSSSPIVSVYRSFAEYSENKSDTGLALLQTVRWQPCNHVSVNPPFTLKH